MKQIRALAIKYPGGKRAEALIKEAHFSEQLNLQKSDNQTNYELSFNNENLHKMCISNNKNSNKTKFPIIIVSNNMLIHFSYI